MSIRLVFVSAVAAATMTGAAFAQQAGDTSVNPPNPAAPPAAPSAAPQTTPRGAPPAASAPDNSAGAGANSVAPASAAPVERVSAAGAVAVISNDPIPDTRANRAKYGKPDSQTGRNSPPSGN
jgi:hypothetical protein